jgi:hypothetical protein
MLQFIFHIYLHISTILSIFTLVAEKLQLYHLRGISIRRLDIGLIVINNNEVFSGSYKKDSGNK